MPSISPTFRFDELLSTQTKAFELLAQGSENSLWVIAQNQTAGKGRLERKWESTDIGSFTASFAFRAPVKNLEGLSLVVGLGALAGLPEDLNLQLKWPNDLMLNSSKVGGILVESRSQGMTAEVVVGVGINISEIEGADGIRYRGLGRSIDEKILLTAIEEKIMQFLKYKKGFEPFQEEYREKIWGLGQEVELSVQGKRIRAEILGVNEKGFLETKKSGLLQILDSGEIVSS